MNLPITAAEFYLVLNIYFWCGKVADWTSHLSSRNFSVAPLASKDCCASSTANERRSSDDASRETSLSCPNCPHTPLKTSILRLFSNNLTCMPLWVNIDCEPSLAFLMPWVGIDKIFVRLRHSYSHLTLFWVLQNLPEITIIAIKCSGHVKIFKASNYGLHLINLNVSTDLISTSSVHSMILIIFANVPIEFLSSSNSGAKFGLHMEKMAFPF